MLHPPAAERDACGLGLVAAAEGRPGRFAVETALAILKRLSHRGARGADGKTGDGAGILLRIPDSFLRGQASLSSLPAPGEYAAASVFLPRQRSEQEAMRARFTEIAREHDLHLLGTRTVETRTEALGAQARIWEPAIQQWFVAPVNPAGMPLNGTRWRRSLYLLRQRSERELRKRASARDPRNGAPSPQFHLASLSPSTVTYKGMLLPEDLEAYFTDLAQPAFESPFALVHSRFSTNTLPAWELAHPYRLLCHNGEINTLRGNLNWMRAREPGLAASLFPPNPAAILPLIGAGQSDSQSLDNAVELLTLAGRELPHALMMAIPEVWESREDLSPARRAFNAFHSHRIEPWDGPAALGYTDGEWIGASLDRNGLRPCRYQLLADGTLILASEAGVIETAAGETSERGKLGPGEILAYHLGEKRLYRNNELRERFATAAPYEAWLGSERLGPLAPATESSPAQDPAPLLGALRRFGYTAEELNRVILPTLRSGEEPISSMGNDTPLAVLSDRPRLLFQYFRQLFAQVTNPPIDPERERVAMSLTTVLGPKANLLSLESDGRARVSLASPLLSSSQLESLLTSPLRARRLGLLFPAAEGSAGFTSRLRALQAEAERAARDGCALLVLSDREPSSQEAVLPSLLAVSAVHHHLLRLGLRTGLSLAVETGEARDPHHFACLIGFGAEAVHPYLIPRIAARLLTDGERLPAGEGGLEARYLAAMEKGLRKILSKMGISPVASYCGAQVFEALGLGQALVEEFFPSTPSPIGGLSLEELARETLLRHAAAGEISSSEEDARLDSLLPPGGDIHFRPGGEAHFWNPTTIATLQAATRSNDPRTYEEFRAGVAELSRFTLRGLLRPKALRPSVPLEEVEPATAILRRFSTGAMSFGALGKEAHETLAVAMNRLGAKSNSGEGGEDAGRFQPDPSGDSRSSAIKQIASGRFGVTAHYLANAQELQIKMAQGAKPGEGGQLPGHKADAAIARLRHSTPGVTLISPPPHHDIYSIEDLAQLIHDLRGANPKAEVSVKLVAEAGVGTIATGVAKAFAGKIVISGDSGGTGASPLSSIRHAGSPWELGLAEAQQALVANGLRSRVRLEADGQLKTGHDVLIAALLGADEFGFSTAPLIVEGCVMMRKCHLNTCPVGVATQDPELRAKFQGKPEYLIRYFHFVAEETRQLLASLGFRSLQEAVGRVDCLEAIPLPAGSKTEGLDLSRLLARPESVIPGLPTERAFLRKAAEQPRRPLEEELLRRAEPALEGSDPVRLRRAIRNSDRSVGALLSFELARRHGARGLPADSLRVDFQGTAGQSFGAFLAPGITFQLEGEANDYVGKGLSGGSLRIFAPLGDRPSREPPVLAGNTCLYGATSGELFLAGRAGERFAVRNSGALAVVEGVGEHGCEYMTGGNVIVLGGVGRNFAAGMSGGVAFVFDPEGGLGGLCNPGTVELEPVRGFDDSSLLLSAIDRHHQLTGSALAARLLGAWKLSLASFVRVMPREYKAALAKAAAVKEARKEVALHG